MGGQSTTSLFEDSIQDIMNLHRDTLPLACWFCLTRTYSPPCTLPLQVASLHGFVEVKEGRFTCPIVGRLVHIIQSVLRITNQAVQRDIRRLRRAESPEDIQRAVKGLLGSGFLQSVREEVIDYLINLAREINCPEIILAMIDALPFCLPPTQQLILAGLHAVEEDLTRWLTGHQKNCTDPRTSERIANAIALLGRNNSAV